MGIPFAEVFGKFPANDQLIHEIFSAFALWLFQYFQSNPGCGNLTKVQIGRQTRLGFCVVIIALLRVSFQAFYQEAVQSFPGGCNSRCEMPYFRDGTVAGKTFANSIEIRNRHRPRPRIWVLSQGRERNQVVGQQMPNL